MLNFYATFVNIRFCQHLNWMKINFIWTCFWIRYTPFNIKKTLVLILVSKQNIIQIVHQWINHFWNRSISSPKPLIPNMKIPGYLNKIKRNYFALHKIRKIIDIDSYYDSYIRLHLSLSLPYLFFVITHNILRN